MILSYRSPLVTLCFRSIRHYSSKKSASSTRYIARQKKDPFSKAAKFLNYKSRAALKLTQIDNEFHIFRPGYSVVDLGFAPGAWTQVAVERTSPNGKVLGVDIIPTNPPKGASAIQANILSKKTHIIVRNFFVDPQHKGEDLEQSYIASEMQETVDRDIVEDEAELPLNSLEKCPVDIVMSDMYVPVETPERFWNNTTNSAYLRMANTTGLVVKDHTSSIDLCDAALIMAIDLLKPRGSFVCKFYTGTEDAGLEKRLKKVFDKVKRYKPEASRQESKELYFVCQNKKNDIDKMKVFS